MKIMTYKGYQASITFKAEDNVFIGRLARINDRILFERESVHELKTTFENAVDDYITTCTERGKVSQKPYSDKMMLRINPQLHARTAMAAELAGISLTKWVEKAMTHEAEHSNL